MDLIRLNLKKISSTEFLLGCGVIGPLLFIVVLLIEGATRPGYSAWRNYGSRSPTSSSADCCASPSR